MNRVLVLAIVVAFIAVPFGFAADPPPLSVAEGKVLKAEKDTLTFEPRSMQGKFGKSISLRITGTSTLRSASYQERADKSVLVQREITVSDLQKDQVIAVIYSRTPKGEPVLLTAVAQPAAR